MFPFTPRYIKEAKHLAHAAKKLLNYRRDLWTDDQVANFEQQISTLKKATKERDRAGIDRIAEEIQVTADKYAPPTANAGWRENCEVIIIAIIIAAGIRSYFLQPFKIPTGSMQPTLCGVIGYPTSAETPAPNLAVRAFQMLWLGRTYFNDFVESDDQIVDLVEHTYAHFFTFTDIICEHSTYKIFAPRDTLIRDFRLFPGTAIQKGNLLVHGHVDTGDQVFVDKLSYNFILPQRGNVFVFKTTGIRRIEDGLDPEMGSEHYIKRLAGTPGDTLRIDSPNLYVNDDLAKSWAFRRVMSCENGYRGYSNPSLYDPINNPHGAFFLTSPKATVTIPSKSYFALGDNSYNSSDSRYWGFVPERNIAGKGFIIYWPFSKRWGFIH
ncbi:MAG: signal peptidase I [Chthoniobacterales bacterium]